MTAKWNAVQVGTLLCAIVGLCMTLSSVARAHCDTMNGPVVTEAKAALEKGDVTPVLKWVSKDNEEEIRTAFKKTLTVRSKGLEARELADMYFFETLVRLHRAGEGAPYTGLKTVPVEPIIAAADKALEAGTADELAKMVTAHVAAGIRERFEKAVEAKKHANDSIEAGREYVEAYVQYTHYVEGLHQAAVGTGAQHGEAHAVPIEGAHAH